MTVHWVVQITPFSACSSAISINKCFRTKITLCQGPCAIALRNMSVGCSNCYVVPCLLASLRADSARRHWHKDAVHAPFTAVGVQLAAGSGPSINFSLTRSEITYGSHGGFDSCVFGAFNLASPAAFAVFAFAAADETSRLLRCMRTSEPKRH